MSAAPSFAAFAAEVLEERDQDGARGLTKAERLEAGALVAPVLRSASEKTLARRIHVVKADDPTWTPIRYAKGADVLRGHARIQELEHVVEEGVRPKEVICEACGRAFRLSPRGGVPKFCEACARPPCSGCNAALPRTSPKRRKSLLCTSCHRQSVRLTARPRLSCAVCGVRLGPHAGTPTCVRRRRGAPPRCIRCANRTSGAKS